MKKKKIIVLLFIIITIINTLMPMTVKATKSSEIFDNNITFSSEYIPENGDIMPHGVITPSTAKSSKSIPLIVWLHGASEFKGDKDTCMGTNNSNLFPRVLMDSSLEKFSAYVLIPHATGKWSNGGKWYVPNAATNVSTLIKEFVKEKKNVDTNNIIIAGHSAGGMGALYMTIHMDQMPYKFSKMVIVSGYRVDGSSNVSIPTRGYFGRGESSSFMSTIPTAEPVIPLQTNHAGTPKAAYSLDENGNNRSDLIEWMFEGYTVSQNTGETDDNDTKKEKEPEEAGELFVDLAQLLCFLPDVVIETLQHMFVTTENIQTTDGEYKIMYSPGAIFSGEVPAFDINFIKPKDTKNDYKDFFDKKIEEYIEEVATKDEFKESKDTFEQKMEKAKEHTEYRIIEKNDSDTKATSRRRNVNYINGNLL